MSKGISYIYTTKVGELLDEIVYRHYGSHKPLQMVLNANRGLSRLKAKLPTGIEITLPPEPVTEVDYVTLWS